MWKMEALATKTQVDIEYGTPAYKRQKYIDLTEKLNNIIDSNYDKDENKYNLLRKIAHHIKIHHWMQI